MSTSDGMSNLYKSIGLLYGVTYNCYQAFNQTLGLNNGVTFAEVGLNVINNAGYIYTDVFNAFTNSP